MVDRRVDREIFTYLLLNTNGISEAGRMVVYCTLASNTFQTCCALQSSLKCIVHLCATIARHVTNSISANRLPTIKIWQRRHYPNILLDLHQKERRLLSLES